MNRIIYAGKHALTFAVSRHQHSSCELIFCTSGGGEMVFDDGRTLRYSANDIAVIPPYLPHSNVSATGFTNIHIYLEDATISQTAPFLIPADPNGFLLGAFSAAHGQIAGGVLQPFLRQVLKGRQAGLLLEHLL